MLVGERMSYPVITVTSDMPISEALRILKSEKIYRAPVVDNGKLVGIVTNDDILNASPSKVSTLSVWEMNYLLSKVTVKDVMTRKVYTVKEDTLIEDAARILADHGIGGLPVMRGVEVVGIITETDLFKLFLEMMGARFPGIRVSVLLPDQEGEIAKLTQAIYKAGGCLLALGTFAGESASNFEVMFKVSGLDQKKIKAILSPLVIRIKDMRKA